MHAKPVILQDSPEDEPHLAVQLTISPRLLEVIHDALVDASMLSGQPKTYLNDINDLIEFTEAAYTHCR